MSDKVYTPLSDDEAGLRVITFYDPLEGTYTIDLKDTDVFPLANTALECGRLCKRISIMDEHYWPPVNPIPGRIEDGEVVALVALDPLTDEGAAHLRTLAEKLGLLFEDIR